jgi:uncharacterized protein (TIGR02466 family)
MPIHNLFPQAVGRYALPRELSEQELFFIKNQDTRANIGNATSQDNSILCRKELTSIRDFIETSVSDYFTTVYNPKHKVTLRITQSWANYTRSGQYHHKHRHPNSFVSGVFYPQADRETDKIYFYKSGFDLIKLPPKDWNTWNSESWWFDVGTGDLLIFPSSLEHMVEPVQGDQTRISLSFNTFLVGNVGEELDLTGLQIGELDGAFRST